MTSDVARISAYNVGFGDSFLLDLPSPSGRRVKVLIDCGSVSFADSGQSSELVVERILRDISNAEGLPHLDVVVATHRHRDHISGFASEAWRRVSVGEVWQPWTEAPHDPDAARLRMAQAELADALVSSEHRLAAVPGLDERVVELVIAMGFNASGNHAAIQTLRDGFAGRPRREYLAREPTPRASDAMGGLLVHVLGPSRDVDVIRRMTPPSGQSYLALLPEAQQGARDEDDRPFPWLAPMTWEQYGSAELNDGAIRKIDHGGAKGQLRKLVGLDSLLTAAGLDHAVNNTSLMLAFEVGDHVLLFPGDAQWGTWQTCMEEDWSAEIVRRATFYKVGHHGSHNATPRRFVDEYLRPGAQFVTSVGRYSRWDNIPKRELLEALSARTNRLSVTTMEPPADPPPGVTVLDGGAVIRFDLDVTL
jgi:beta-lactamase superfamily II metal-dependent hydrolase